MPRPAAPRLARFLAPLAVLAVLAAPAPAVSARSHPFAPPAGPEVSFDMSSPGGQIPADFLGLSFEVKALPRIASYSTRGNLVGLLRSLGGGLLRFGGVTADTQVAWTRGGPLPSWASMGLTAADFGPLASLADQAGWRVLMTLNLGHYDPASAADEAAAAHQALGDTLAYFAFGNEPDALVRPDELRSDPWSFLPYLQQVQGLQQALVSAAARVPLAGPDVSSGRARLAWAAAEARYVRPALLTAHFYSKSCQDYPLTADLLSPGVKATETRTLAAMAGLGNRTGLPVRVDETNNISCGGEAGVSNTFASALWATDFLVRAMAAGVAGVNFHGELSNPLGYGPLAADQPADLQTGQLSAHPEWYALLLADLLLGDQPIPTTLHQGGLSVSGQAFLGLNGAVHVVLVNEHPQGSRTLLVSFRPPASLAAAGVLRLTAPAVNATSGVRLGGAAVAADGSWTPPPAGRLIPRRHGAITVALPASSAALVTLYPRR